MSATTARLNSEQLDRLTDVFRGVFNQPELKLFEEMTAADVQGWDSFNHINLVITIEQEFNCRFSTAEVSSLKNVGDLMNLLANNVPS